MSRIQIRRRGDFFQPQDDAHLAAQPVQFVRADRRKTSVVKRRIARDVPGFFNCVRKLRGQSSNAPAQFPVRAAKGHKNAMPFAENALRRQIPVSSVPPNAAAIERHAICGSGLPLQAVSFS